MDALPGTAAPGGSRSWPAASRSAPPHPQQSPAVAPWSVVDLFSGAGGMSYGFHAHPGFRVLGAVDAQLGKPSARPGSLGCNAAYLANIGVRPLEADLAAAGPVEVCQALAAAGPDRTGPDWSGAGPDWSGARPDGSGARPDWSGITVLAACPPCTGFSRTLARNHVTDDSRNGLVERVADYAALLRPQIVLVENARELVMGRFRGHLRSLLGRLAALGYRTSATTHFLSDFGLPQKRERALIIAVRRPLPLRGMADLWAGLTVSPKATHVRRAIWELPPLGAGQADPDDALHTSPALNSALNQRRLAAIRPDGGGWADLVAHPEAGSLLTPAMRRRAELGDFGSHPDVYGRLWWDRPAVTIKRECGHIGNGRYAHPEQDRLCTVRELSILQGFPRGYTFAGSLSNMYRQVGDAVPPLISYQLSVLCQWILTGERPDADQMILAGCHLTCADLEPAAAR
jgi:DNA (cytosine-5)-methyltransferase 1